MPSRCSRREQPFSFRERQSVCGCGLAFRGQLHLQAFDRDAWQPACQLHLTSWLALQVTITLPDAVDLQDTVALRKPHDRTVQWRYFYANGQRHAVEAMDGNRCAFCHMMCPSFKVCMRRQRLVSGTSWQSDAIAIATAVV